MEVQTLSKEELEQAGIDEHLGEWTTRPTREIEAEKAAVRPESNEEELERKRKYIEWATRSRRDNSFMETLLLYHSTWPSVILSTLSIGFKVANCYCYDAGLFYNWHCNALLNAQRLKPLDKADEKKGKVLTRGLSRPPFCKLIRYSQKMAKVRRAPHSCSSRLTRPHARRTHSDQLPPTSRPPNDRPRCVSLRAYASARAVRYRRVRLSTLVASIPTINMARNGIKRCMR